MPCSHWTTQLQSWLSWVPSPGFSSISSIAPDAVLRCLGSSHGSTGTSQPPAPSGTPHSGASVGHGEPTPSGATISVQVRWSAVSQAAVQCDQWPAQLTPCRQVNSASKPALPTEPSEVKRRAINCVPLFTVSGSKPSPDNPRPLPNSDVSCAPHGLKVGSLPSGMPHDSSASSMAVL